MKSREKKKVPKKKLITSIFIDTDSFMVVKLYCLIFKAGGILVLWRLKLELS